VPSEADDLPWRSGSQFIGAMLEAATPRLGGQCAKELAMLKNAFGMSLHAGDVFLMATDGQCSHHIVIP
jgi:hypothetical protein